MTAGRTNSNALSQHWCTPVKYVEAIRDFFGGTISLDPCSNQHSIVGAKVEYLLPEIDGLTASWNYPTIFVNPPYGRDKQRQTTIRDWLKKCYLANSEFGSEVLALVPVATNTGHWKNYVFGVATGICFLYDTRLKFLVDGVEGGKGAPMSCAIVYWGRDYARFEDKFIGFGATVHLDNLQSRNIGKDPNQTTIFDNQYAA